MLTYAQDIFGNIKSRLTQTHLPEKGRVVYRRTIRIVERKPLTSLLVLLGILLTLIIIGSIMRKPQAQKTPERAVKDVTTYSIGTAPKVTVQAQVEKSGIITIVALTPGVVSEVFVTEGQTVDTNTTLLSIGSNYAGGNAASLQRQLASATYQSAKDTFDTQKDIIAKQRDIAKQTEVNADQIREITEQSLSGTESLINLNNEITKGLQSNLDTLEATNVNGVNNQAILATKQQLSQFSGAINQLSTALAQARLQAQSNGPQETITHLQKDIALKQLDIQEKALKLSLETSGLQLRIAQVNEAAFYPTAPFVGVVERVYVNPGQSVNPGTRLVTLHGDQTAKIIARVSRDIAQNASSLEFSRILIDGTPLQSTPLYITSDATDGSLYSIIYTLPPEYQNAVSQMSYIPVEIPIGHADTGASVPFIPIDTVYQTQNAAYLFVNENGTAKARQVTLGGIFGRFVEITHGLRTGDQVILDRTVIEGDKIQLKKS